MYIQHKKRKINVNLTMKYVISFLKNVCRYKYQTKKKVAEAFKKSLQLYQNMNLINYFQFETFRALESTEKLNSYSAYFQNTTVKMKDISKFKKGSWKIKASSRI